MKRKIIKLGSATHVVSIPKKWLNNYGLKTGEEIDVTEQGKQLIIRTERDTALNKYTIDITYLSPLTNYGLTALYIRGLDELEVLSDKPEQISKLHEKPINQFVGFEIVEQSKNRALIKDVTGIKELDLNTLLRRIFLLILSLSEETINALKKKEIQLDHLLSIDLNINRFSFLCLRILNKRGADDYRTTPTIYYLVTQLESIGDEYKHFAEYIMKTKTKTDQNTITQFEKIHNLLREYYSIFFKFDTNKATEIDTTYRKIICELEKKHNRPLIFTEQIANRIADMLRNQLAITL